MSYRGDGEPEYIDDDEYFDPDDFGASGRRSNVLGGSGSRPERAFHEEAPEDQPSRGGGSRAGRERVKHPAGGRSSGRKTLKARNPAPAVASSEERRARLAGKTIKHKDRSTAGGQDKNQSAPAGDKARGTGRLAGLRARLARGTERNPEPSASAERDGASGGQRLTGRLRDWRPNLSLPGWKKNDPPQDRAARPAQPDGDSKFAARGSSLGASRGSARPAEAKPARASKAPRLESSDWLDLDRKLDLLGVALVFGAIVLAFSALSPERATIGALHQLIGQLLGWGAIAVPIAMFAVGLWLIIRHFGDEPPTVDPLRLTGLVLAFLGALVLFQFADSLTYGEAIAAIRQCANPSNPACVEALVHHSYLAGRGGGFLGGWIYSALVNNLTELGGGVVVLMVLTFGAMLITRSSMAELAIVAIGIGRNLRTKMAQAAAGRRTARLAAQRHLTSTEPDVRVSKPEAPRLAGVMPAGALPEPSAEAMPIPDRLRLLFSWPRRLIERASSDAPPLQKEPPETDASSGGRLTHFAPDYLKRGDRFSAARYAADPEANPAPRAGYIERFLNLGDDLPNPANMPEQPPNPSMTPQAPPTSSAGGQEIVNNIAGSLKGDAGPAPAPAAHSAESKRDDQGGHKADSLKDMPAKPARMPNAPPAIAQKPAPNRDLPQLDPAASAAPPQAIDGESAEAGDPVRKPPAAPARRRFDWDMPAVSALLTRGSAGDLDQEPLIRQAQIIEETLAAFGAPGRVVEVNSGPVITQYGVEPGYLTASSGKRNRVKVGAIAKLDKDLQLALGARSVRMEAPVPGKGYVGIEVPNPDSVRVSLRDVMESKGYQRINSPLAIALGMSVDGSPISADLTQMPHLLIAGTTGSGKSVCINAIINSILATNSPETVKFIMVDPKRVELTGYNGLPHLVAPVVVELERIIGVLRWVTTEMDERYKVFSRAGARNIVDFNAILDPDLAPMPYIVVIIDELADLMMMAPDDTERAIARIAALARATGIHLVIATQRPSVDVVTGLIKANCPARIAFAVAGSVDSRVILDQPGAERLLGKGDMLYLSGDSPAPLRMQGVHVSNEEIDSISRFWKLQGAGLEGVKPIPLPPASSPPRRSRAADAPRQSAGGQGAFWDMSPQRGMASETAAGNPNPEEDELYQTAVEMVRRLEKASISLLQRRLRIGYTRAARLVDMMEERGVVGPPKEGSSKPRDVLPEKSPPAGGG